MLVSNLNQHLKFPLHAKVASVQNLQGIRIKDILDTQEKQVVCVCVASGRLRIIGTRSVLLEEHHCHQNHPVVKSMKS